MILYIKAEKDKKWSYIGQTPHITNCLDPTFLKPFTINYQFERNQKLKFEVFDYDDVTDHDLIGAYECYMNALLTANN